MSKRSVKHQNINTQAPNNNPPLNVQNAYSNLPVVPNLFPQGFQMAPQMLHYTFPQNVLGSPIIPQYQQQQQFNQKMCLLCKKEPKFTCSRCDGFYCSNDCQRSDWPSHRFTCFAMPPLIPMKSKNRTVPPIAQLPKDQCNVKVTGFRRTNLCYVRSVEQSVDESFKKGCDDVMNFGRTAQPMVELPQANTYALAYWNQYYYRVQILSISSKDKIRVLFIDLGNVKTVHLEHLRHISSCIVNILQHAVAIKLKGVENYILTEEEMETTMKQFCDKEFVLEYNDDDVEEREFTLKCINSNSTLNEMISTLAACSPIKMNVFKEDKPAKDNEKPACSKKADEINIDQLSRVSIKNTIFPIEVFKVGKSNFAVKILNNIDIKNGLFGCIERSDEVFFDKAKSYLKSYHDNFEAYEPQVGEYCMAFVDNEWCRVKILSIFSKKYSVINIDTTHEYKITHRHLRRYPDNFTVPCKTVKCKLDGLQPKTGNKYIDDYLKLNFGLNKIQRITTVTKIQNNIVFVKMDEIIKDLMHKIRSLQSELSNLAQEY